MGMNLDAMLRISAQVTGQNAIEGLGKSITKISRIADGFTPVLGNLAAQVTGLLGATGIGLMAKNAIDLGDSMNDLRQKTGVSVETLSQLAQAADKSGTSLEGVAKSMAKLSKGLDTGKAQLPLAELGISATDASGKLKTADEILIEVADRFKGLPDGIGKTAMAMKLFGKSGADMIPMLNMGGQAIKELGVTMSSEFAAKADEFNDKLVDLKTKGTELAIRLAETLMPAITGLTDVTIKAVTAFGRLPQPIQNVVIGLGLLGGAALLLAPLISSLQILLALFAGAGVAATISGWLGALAPFSQLAIAAVTPFLAWMTGTLLPALVGIFSGPVGWIALGVAALVAGVIYFREPIMGFLEWALGAIGEWWTKVFEFIYATQIEPWVKLWNADLLAPIRKALGGWLDGIKKFFAGIIDYVNREWMKPWTDWWINLGKQPEIFLDRVRGKISDLIIFLTKGMQSAAAAIQAAFNNAGQSVARIWNWITRGTANGLNVVIDAYNAAAASANRFPGLKLPILQRMAVPAEIPALARGGHMMAPTLAVIGEGGDPGGEYAIPSSRMDAATAGWAQGLRGQALVNSWQNPGLAPGRSTTAPAAPTTINLTLQQQGPTLQMPDGSQWVTRQEMATTTQAAMDGIMRLMASGPVRANLRIR
jgi:TP901 family phage tail tape measure protein